MGETRSVRFPFEDSREVQLRIARNVRRAEAQALSSGRGRPPIDDGPIRDWHRDALSGVELSSPHVAGRYRGDPIDEALRVYTVRLKPSGYWGARPEAVAGAVERFVADLRTKITQLDARVAPSRAGKAEREMIVQALAFAHGEWIRIHPFVNCNGTTARLWLVWLGARYGLGGVVQSKPTPPERAAWNGRVFTYVDAAIRQMAGDNTQMEAWLNSRLILLC